VDAHLQEDRAAVLLRDVRGDLDAVDLAPLDRLKRRVIGLANLGYFSTSAFMSAS
jgi:hypothetical protein